MRVFIFISISTHIVVAFAPIFPASSAHHQLRHSYYTDLPTLTIHKMTTSDNPEGEEELSSIDKFLIDPVNPLLKNLMRQLLKSSPEMWDPIKYQLGRVPVFYCGVEDVQPPLPIRYFMNVDEAKSELESLLGGAGENERESNDSTKIDVLPIMLGDAFENMLMGHAVFNTSLKDRWVEVALSDLDDDNDDASPPVSVFGVQMSVKSEEDDGRFDTCLTDTLYFDEKEAQRALKEIGDEQGSEDLKFDMFTVSLDKAVEYMILNNKSGFKFEFIPPQLSLDYLASKYGPFDE